MEFWGVKVRCLLQALIVVNHMIFLKGLAFRGSQSGLEGQGRTLRTKPW